MPLQRKHWNVQIHGVKQYVLCYGVYGGQKMRSGLTVLTSVVFGGLF